MVGVQFAAAAAASDSTAGAAALVTKRGSRLGSTTAARTGNASRTSGWMATAAPASQAARLVLEPDSARTAYSSNPIATASSGWPHRMVTFHRAVALAAASRKRLGRVAPRRSAIASAANRATAEMTTA